MPRTEFRYDLEQSFGTLSRNETASGNAYTKEVNLISYNDADPVYDIRNWTLTAGGERRMGKGITLSLEEMRALRDLLAEMEELDPAE
ncbi:MAG: hypothetical protein IJ120_08415 [Solobacterium sp.]|nr:hypothetical protein [Solobacterium sp.]